MTKPTDLGLDLRLPFNCQRYALIFTLIACSLYWGSSIITLPCNMRDLHSNVTKITQDHSNTATHTRIDQMVKDEIFLRKCNLTTRFPDTQDARAGELPQYLRFPRCGLGRFWQRSIQRNTCATLWSKLAKLGLHLCSCLSGQSWCI